MWDDILELILWIFDDIIDFFRIAWKERNEKKKRKKRMKNNEMQTGKDLYKGGEALWMIMNT